jgi:hypothetical protein
MDQALKRFSGRFGARRRKTTSSARNIAGRIMIKTEHDLFAPRVAEGSSKLNGWRPPDERAVKRPASSANPVA